MAVLGLKSIQSGIGHQPVNIFSVLWSPTMEYYNMEQQYYQQQMMMPTYSNTEQSNPEYLSSLNALRNSFDMGYGAVFTSGHESMVCQSSGHNNADDTSSDSGVPSDHNMEDFPSPGSDLVSPNLDNHGGCNINSRQMRYFAEREEKPLSAWKLKQLKLTPAGIKKRRKDANARERKRMNGLNEAFERLRDAVPAAPGEEETGDKNKKLSKMDTLQMANLYIRHLVTLLNSDKASFQ